MGQGPGQQAPQARHVLQIAGFSLIGQPGEDGDNPDMTLCRKHGVGCFECGLVKFGKRGAIAGQTGSGDPGWDIAAGILQ